MIGGLLGAPLELVPCVTQPGLLVPARAEIVLEGRIALAELVDEGRFGEFTGYGEGTTRSPVLHVEAMRGVRPPRAPGADALLSWPGLSHATPQLELMGSRQFPNWLAEQRTSLAFTTYQAGKLFFIGVQPDRSLSIFERTFNRCMGLSAAGNTLWMSSLVQLWRFENVLPPGSVHEGYDALFVPQLAYTTGDIDVHDIAVDHTGEPLFVNTLFGCLARPSITHSFRPVWRPPFISKLAPEDRCHLNGLALRDGEPAFVTATSRSDVADGWRDRRVSGGCVIDVASGATVIEGLSMPHSPRWYRDRLWLLDSGTGFFGHVDLGRGTFERVCFCPGFARGLAFVGDFAVVGLSKPRDNKTFADLPLATELAARDGDPRCGVQVIDLRSGDAVHWLRIEGVVSELYDVVALPGVRRPMALGFVTDEIRRMLTVEESQTP